MARLVIWDAIAPIMTSLYCNIGFQQNRPNIALINNREYYESYTGNQLPYTFKNK